MEKFKLFKIWDVTRTKKCLVKIEIFDSDDVLERTILKASEKLDINGSCLVLECDGTAIDESDILCLLNKDDVIVLLCPGELWVKDFDVNLSDTLSATSSAFGSNLSEEIIFETVTESSSKDTNEINTATVVPTSIDLTDMQSETVNHSALKEFNSNIILPPRLINEELWRTLDLRWEDMSKKTRDALEKEKTLWQEVVHQAVNQMREISKYLPRSAIRIVARRIIQKYPQFTDKINGEVVGCGYYQMFLKIQDHNNYLNRNEKNPKPLRGSKTPLSRRKILANKTSGRPKFNVETTVSVNILDKKKQLDTLDIKKDYTKLFNVLEEILPSIVEFIDSDPTIESYLNEWPIIFNEPVTYWLYSKIMGHSINNLTKSLSCENNKNKIIKYAKSKNITTSEENNDILNIIELISKLFKENINDIYKIHEDGTLLSEIYLSQSTPMILAVPQAGKEGNIYYISFNGKIVNTGNESFEDALKQIFALFFILNEQYPKQFSSTLEFIQRFCLGINPQKGTRNTKQSGRIVFSTIKKINNI